MSNRKLVYGLVLLLVAVLFGILLVRNLLKPTKDGNQISNEQSVSEPSPAIVNGVVGLLSPDEINTSVNEEFIIAYSITNVNDPITATDLLLNYNPDEIEFVRVDNLNSDYLNPRALKDDQRLILSFVAKLGSEPVATSSVAIADLVFRPIQSGLKTIKPILNNSPAESIVTISGSEQNQLQTINSVNVVVQ